jgi:hypothetical protein
MDRVQHPSDSEAISSSHNFLKEQNSTVPSPNRIGKDGHGIYTCSLDNAIGTKIVYNK